MASSSHPRPLHPGGFSLPPLVEDRLPIVAADAAAGTKKGREGAARTDLLLVRPPDMESLWEWQAYTKHQTNSDPSWGRVWPTALSLSRLILQSSSGYDMEMNANGEHQNTDQELTRHALDALRTSSHAVEVGCGLGVVGLAFASAFSNEKRTITFLDREPYALHCAMASASTNGFGTGPLVPVGSTELNTEDHAGNNPITARAAMDYWALRRSDDEENTDISSPSKNICYEDLHLNEMGGNNQNTIVLASDILYEPSSATPLAAKIKSLLHPVVGGYALIADPLKERTAGCRDAFFESVRELGGEVTILSMPDLERRGDGLGPTGDDQKVTLLEGDLDIDGSLAKTVLIVVHFKADEGSTKKAKDA